MSFVQIIQFGTGDIDTVRKQAEAWEQATEGRRTVRRSILARRREDADQYVNIVFFDSHEDAMANSALPETQALAAELEASHGAATFHDLDVIDDRS